MYVESNWPYFVGFGLPLAIFTSLAPSFVIRLVQKYREESFEAAVQRQGKKS